jgi:hypothetical protein
MGEPATNVSVDNLSELMALFGSKGAIEERIKFCNSYSRLPSLLEIGTFCDYDDWLGVVGDWWTSFDNVSQFLGEIMESPLFIVDWPARSMMTTEENEQLDALPDEVIVYRGCYQRNKRGICWTLDKAIAERFPTLNRYQQSGQPLLVKGRVKKTDIIALKNDREEAEIVALGVKIISTSHIRI